MRTLSLWQPWASAVALGHKRIETRHWSTAYRGTLAIHAAKRWTAEERFYADLFADLYSAPELAKPPLGAVVAIADLVDVVPTDALNPQLSRKEEAFGNYAPGRYGWVLGNVRPLPAPILVKGMQGLFNLPQHIVAQVCEQVE